MALWNPGCDSPWLHSFHARLIRNSTPLTERALAIFAVITRSRLSIQFKLVKTWY